MLLDMKAILIVLGLLVILYFAKDGSSKRK
jgi:hypothetical protein